MQLFFSNSEFVWHGVPCPGVPFLCYSNMELVDAPNRYLRHIATTRGRTRSPNTWRTYGNHLYEFFAFLEENSIAWENPTHNELAAWRNSMIQRNCSRATVNQRLRCVHSFYEWSVLTYSLSTQPFSKQDLWVRKNKGFLTHVDVSGGRIKANDLTLQEHKNYPKFLHMDSAIEFLEAATPHTVKLMGYLALLTGMRREEVIALDYRVIPNPGGHDSEKNIAMVLDVSLTPTKGQKTRTVMLPYDLAVALWDYFNRVWPKRNRIYEREHGGKRTSKLFLSEYGNEFSLRYLNNAFNRISKKTGILCHPHMLRHTFGTYELIRMSRKYGEVKALLWVRDRLGHTSISTTEIYVHTADLLRNQTIDGYQIEVLETLRNGAQKTEN